MSQSRTAIFVLLLFSAAQPTPNFLACTLRMHQFASARSAKDDCCRETAPCCTERADRAFARVGARPYLPCCESAVPFGSVTEHPQTPVSSPSHPVAVNAHDTGIDEHLPALGPTLPLPLKSPGREVLNLNLRI